MKKTILLAVIAAMPILAYAKFTTMVFYTASGSQKIAAEGLEITISGTKLNAVAGSEKLELDLASLTAMQFADNDGLGVAGVDADCSGEVEIYTVGGISKGKYENVATAIKKLDAGVYVAKSESGTATKIIVR